MIQGRLGDEIFGKGEWFEYEHEIKTIERDPKRRETRKDSMTFHPR